MKRATSSTRKSASKTSAAAKKGAAKAAAKKSGGRKAGGTPKERKPKRKAGGTPKERKPKRKAGGTPKEKKPKRKAGGTPKERKPRKKTTGARAVAAKASPAPAKKPPARKKGAARRAATAVMDAAKTVAAVVSAPVRAVAAVVAGPSADSPQDSAGAANGADTRSSGDDATMVAADPVTLLGRIESAYGVTLPDRYRRFLRDGEYTRYPRIELAGYIRGPYDLDFVDDLLPDVSELGQNAGIYDMDDVPWSDDYAGYVPLASLSHPDVDEPKVFLVHQVGGERHRVLLFDYEGWRLYPLAESFESFLANLPKATNDISTAFRPGA